MKGTPLALANDIAFAAIFTVCRMVLGPWLTYATVMSPTSHAVVKVRNAGKVASKTTLLMATTQVGALAIQGISVVWFWKILQA